jgi:hypothetical protein
MYFVWLLNLNFQQNGFFHFAFLILHFYLVIRREGSRLKMSKI